MYPVCIWNSQLECWVMMMLQVAGFLPFNDNGIFVYNSPGVAIHIHPKTANIFVYPCVDWKLIEKDVCRIIDKFCSTRMNELDKYDPDSLEFDDALKIMFMEDLLAI